MITDLITLLNCGPSRCFEPCAPCGCSASVGHSADMNYYVKMKFQVTGRATRICQPIHFMTVPFTALNLAFLFCFICGSAGAQQSTHISGRVQDNDTGKSLARASITLKGRTINTIANDEGAFSFYVPDLYKNDTLHVSAIGYESFEVPLREIEDDKRLVVRLIPSALSLQEVVITEMLAPEDILRLAINKIRQNYYSKPFIQQAFYREVQQGNGRYVSLIEAALEIHNRDQHLAGQAVKVLQLRKTKGHRHLTNPSGIRTTSFFHRWH